MRPVLVKALNQDRVSWSHIPCSENRTRTLSPATDVSKCAKHTSILSQSSVTHGSCGSCTATTHLESIVPTTSLVPFPEHDLVACGDWRVFYLTAGTTYINF